VAGIPFSLQTPDPEAQLALQRVLRVAAAALQDDVFAEEIGRVVTEIAGDGDRDEIARRVAWLVFTVVATVACFVEEGDDEDAADRLCDLGLQVEARIEALLARLAARVDG
jgi:hypothetical protein